MAHRDPGSPRRISATDPFALSVPCERCRSAVGAPCRTYTGARKPPCRERRAQAALASEPQAASDVFAAEPERDSPPLCLELQELPASGGPDAAEQVMLAPVVVDRNQLPLF